MKKLFFLCVFLFTSMQMQAQLYLAYTYRDFVDTTGDGYGDTYNCYMSIIAPDGSVSNIDLTCPDSNPSGMTTHMEQVNQELNSIINDGYKLIEVISHETNTLGLLFNTYYLAVP